MTPDHPLYTDIVEDPRYKDKLTLETFPMFESLQMTIERTLPYWNKIIVPEVCQNKYIY